MIKFVEKQADFDRNREGIYGGLPQVRQESAFTDAQATDAKQSTKADFDRNRDGIYGGLPQMRQ